VTHFGWYGEVRVECPGAAAEVAVGLSDLCQGIAHVASCRAYLNPACLAVAVGHQDTRVSEKRVYEIGRQ
jgi:hypothetical protein